MSIKLSDKHGVNPTLGVCFWSGKPTGELALLGRLPGDEKAARNSVLSYDPCDEVAKMWARGVVFIEVTHNPKYEGQPPIDIVQDLYPTGRWAVVDTSLIAKVMRDPKMIESIIAKGKCLVEKEVYERLGLHVVRSEGVSDVKSPDDASEVSAELPDGA